MHNPLPQTSHQTRTSRDVQSQSSSLPRRSFLATLAGATAAFGMGEVLGRDYGPNAPPVRYPDPDIIALDKRFEATSSETHPSSGCITAKDALGRGAGLECVGKFLLWSDIPNNVQMRWLEEDGHVSVFRNPAGNSNGNTFDYRGPADLLRARQPPRRPLRTQRQDHCAGRQVGKANRSMPPTTRSSIPMAAIWFTDPGYGSLMNYEGNKGELEIKEAVYRIDAKTGKIDKVTDEIFKPNGLCFSPDYKKLYVADTGASHYRTRRGTSRCGTSWTARSSARERVRLDGARTASIKPASPTGFGPMSTATSGPVPAGWATAMTASMSSPPTAIASGRSCCRKSAATSASAAPSGTGCS